MGTIQSDGFLFLRNKLISFMNCLILILLLIQTLPDLQKYTDGPPILRVTVFLKRRNKPMVMKTPSQGNQAEPPSLTSLPKTRQVNINIYLDGPEKVPNTASRYVLPAYPNELGTPNADRMIRLKTHN
jgi:hypothetical protein